MALCSVFNDARAPRKIEMHRKNIAKSHSTLVNGVDIRKLGRVALQEDDPRWLIAVVGIQHTLKQYIHIYICVYRSSSAKHIEGQGYPCCI